MLFEWKLAVKSVPLIIACALCVTNEFSAESAMGISML